MNILAFGIGNVADPDLFIVLLIVLVFFGAKKLPGLARTPDISTCKEVIRNLQNPFFIED